MSVNIRKVAISDAEALKDRSRADVVEYHIRRHKSKS